MSDPSASAAAAASPINWYRVPLAKEKLRELTQRSDWKGFLQTVPYLLLLVLTGAAAFYAYARFPLWLFFIVLFIHGTFYRVPAQRLSRAGARHRVQDQMALNAVFLRIFAFLSWNSHVRFRASHIRHHASTLHPPDDEEVVLPIRLTVMTWLKCAIVNPLGLWKVAGRLRQPERRPHAHPVGAHAVPGAGRGGPAPPGRWARILLLGHLAIIVVSIATGHWLFAVVTSLARFYGGGFQWICNITQHIGLQDNVPDFRLCCRTIQLNPFLRYLYFQMNWHTEHHMYAAVPCYNLSEAPPGDRARDAGHLSRPDPGLAGDLQHFNRRQKADPAYQHVYELPRAAHA